MNHGIGNVKAKGGGHPTITLSASQFSDATNLTFTQAQAEILQNNEVVNVVLPDNTTSTFYKITNDYMSSGAILFSQSIQNPLTDNGGKMENVLVLCNPSTYVGTVIQLELKGTVANPTLSGNETELTSIGIGSAAYKVGGGKQLYQHNIMVSKSTSTLTFTLSIISNRATAYDITSLLDYIKANTECNPSNIKEYTTKPYIIVSGESRISNRVLIGIAEYNSTVYLIRYDVVNLTTDGVEINTDWSVNDNVITL